MRQNEGSMILYSVVSQCSVYIVSEMKLSFSGSFFSGWSFVCTWSVRQNGGSL